MPLLEHAKTRFPARLRVPGSVSGRAYLMNSELLRYADFNNRSGHSFWLGVPGDEGFVLVNGADEYVVPPNVRGDIQVSGLSQRKRTIVSQRGVDQYFEAKLFASPYAPATAVQWLKDEYEESLVVERLELVPWYENTGAWGLLGGSLAVVGAGIGLHVHSQNMLDELARENGSYYYDDALERRTAAALQRDVATSLYAIGGAATLGSILWFALEQQTVTTRYKPPIKVDIGPRGVRLEAAF